MGRRMYKVFQTKKLIKRKRVPRKIRPLSISLKEHMSMRDNATGIKKDVEMAEQIVDLNQQDKSDKFDKDGHL